jgi:hypothetical protein
MIGTTTPIYIPRQGGSESIIRPGKDYFLVQLYAAQAAFTGSVWERVRTLLIMSQINLHRGGGEENLHAIQRARHVQPGRAEQLGLCPNLIDLVPAVMPSVFISVEFVLDRENRMEALTGLINDDSFLAAVSLAPGAAAAAKIVGGLAQKLVHTFLDVEKRKPILQFSGDFNIATADLREGYYAILGSRDEKNPIPDQLPALSVVDGQLLVSGENVRNISYVVLDVRRTEARTRDLNADAPWEAKLRAAEARAEDLLQDPLASENDLIQGWRECQAMLREAQALVRSDPNYLREETDAIVRAVYARCCALVEKAPTTRGVATGSQITADTADARSALSIAPDENLEVILDDYANRVTRSRRVFHEVGIG